MGIQRHHFSSAVKATWPLLLAFVGALVLCHSYVSAGAEKTSLFKLEKWLAVMLVLNTSIICAGTLELFWTGYMKNFKKSLSRGIEGLLLVATIVLSSNELVKWHEFMYPDAHSLQDLSRRLHDSELRSLLIFFLFFVIDLLGMIGTFAEKAAEAKAERSFYLRCITIIDIPVAVIVGLVILIHGYLFVHPGQITELGVREFGDTVVLLKMTNPPLRQYGEMIGISFAAGAVVAHIFLSQLAFAFFKWEYYEELSKLRRELSLARRVPLHSS